MVVQMSFGAFAQSSSSLTQLSGLCVPISTNSSCLRRRLSTLSQPVMSSRGARSNHSKRPRRPKRVRKPLPRNEDVTDISHPFPGDDPHVPLPPPLPEAKFEIDQYYGFREEDDEFWEHFRVQKMAFRAGTSLTPDLLKPPKRPLDRHGNPPAYPAAARYDIRTKTWVATSEEEERYLREPSPVRDPFFVCEAMANETHTSLRAPRIERSLDESDPETLDADLFQPKASPQTMATHLRKPLQLPAAAWRVVHLGTSSAIPTLKRNVSSTAVLIDTQAPHSSSAPTSKEDTDDVTPAMFLVDAGENTEARLLQCEWCMTHGFRWIRAIFITHLHGDHIYGLPKLLYSIGRFAQFRRRIALERGEESDPVIRIFGPYGTRGFLRTSLHWTVPLGVRFSVSELVPRNTDFTHLSGYDPSLSDSQIVVHDMKTGEISLGSGIDLKHSCPPPLDEEVRAEDIVASEDGLWHVWKEPCDNGRVVEVVAAPLRHRVPCFGYVFREIQLQSHKKDTSATAASSENGILSGDTIEIDKEKAKALGVYGSQFRVLRSGRSVTISKTGRTVTPQEVCLNSEKAVDEVLYPRTVTILGDTCNSSQIAEAAHGSELLVHEATFAQTQADKARVAMHSTARMAGEFGRSIAAKKIALTHFSSRYEAMLMDEKKVNKRGKRGGGIVIVEDEEKSGFVEDNFAEGEHNLSSDPFGMKEEAHHTSEDEDVFGVFSPPYSTRLNGKPAFDDVLDAFEHSIHEDSDDGDHDLDAVMDTQLTEDEDEDYVSVNILVREAYEGHGDPNIEIIAAHDFMEHDILPKFVKAEMVAGENGSSVPQVSQSSDRASSNVT